MIGNIIGSVATKFISGAFGGKEQKSVQKPNYSDMSKDDIEPTKALMNLREHRKESEPAEVADIEELPNYILWAQEIMNMESIHE